MIREGKDGDVSQESRLGVAGSWLNKLGASLSLEWDGDTGHLHERSDMWDQGCALRSSRHCWKELQRGGRDLRTQLKVLNPQPESHHRLRPMTLTALET